MVVARRANCNDSVNGGGDERAGNTNLLCAAVLGVRVEVIKQAEQAHKTELFGCVAKEERATRTHLLCRKSSSSSWYTGVDAAQTVSINKRNCTSYMTP
jgi:hypothetical protein